ncbi:MAG: hypothetical protein KY455_13405 [Euryarchaeota archaeon]|nr:hypothetical protein [Euryarchaeota archaeon]
MQRALLGALLLAITTLAGCIAGDTGVDDAVDPTACDPAPYDPDGVQYVGTDHDPIASMSVENALLTETTFKRTCSLPAIGWSALSQDGTPHMYIGEIDFRGDLDLGAVAVLGNQETPRVYLVDISDRVAPKVLSHIDQQNTYIVDVKISDDGKLLFTASQKIPTSPEFEGLAELEGPAGFTVYDISDPTQPRYLMTEPDPQLGCHMMSHEIIGDTETLLCVSQQVRIYTLSRESGSVQVTGVVDWMPEEDGAARPSDPPLVRSPAEPLDPVFGALPWSSGPHDMTVQKDGDKTYAIVSHWDAGLRIVDVTDPLMPTEVGKWTGEDATYYAGNVHTAMMFYVGEDRYIIASPEYTSENDPVPSLWVLDANDLTAPKLVAEWFHPGEHPAQGLFLTTHQWQVAPTGKDVNASDVRIYLSYNHAGIWVLDLGHILMDHDQEAILGYNIARSEIPEEVYNKVKNTRLATWDVNVVDGHIYGSDRATGLWVFHYTEDALGDVRVTGFA